MSRRETRTVADEYTVRRYDSGDREGVLSLYGLQWDDRPGDDWFEWKYVSDPYLSHVPITVAERGGEIVGAQAYLPCRIRWGNDTALALQPTDAVVHPDHRRQGLYSRITREAIDFYVDREPAFFYNFPNEAALHAQEKLGWSAVTEVANYYRLQRATELVDPTGADRVTRALGRAADSVASAYVGIRDFSANVADDVDVTRHSSVPVDALTALYESNVPEAFHVRRDEQFYRWFFDSPSYEYATYVARRDGSPVASLTTRTKHGRKVLVMDALPTSDRPEALADLLAAAVADNGDANVVAASGSTLGPDLLASFGFVSDDRPVVSRLCAPKYAAIRRLWATDEDGPVSRDALADPENWRFTFVEQTD